MCRIVLIQLLAIFCQESSYVRIKDSDEDIGLDSAVSKFLLVNTNFLAAMYV